MKWAEMTGLELWVLNGRNAVDHALRQLEARGVDLTEITPQVRELANRIARRAWEEAAELLWALIARMQVPSDGTYRASA